LTRSNRRKARGYTDDSGREVSMSEQEHEAENGEELTGEEAPASDGDGWEETNDEPAQGEGGQDVV
jgi:hypothetical protein